MSENSPQAALNILFVQKYRIFRRNVVKNHLKNFFQKMLDKCFYILYNMRACEKA